MHFPIICCLVFRFNIQQPIVKANSYFLRLKPTMANAILPIRQCLVDIGGLAEFNGHYMSGGFCDTAYTETN